MRYHLWSVSEDSRVVISLKGLFVYVDYVVLNQGCFRTCQYNLLDRMLRHDVSTTWNQGYLKHITLVSMTYQSRGSVSPIYPFVGKWSMKSIICPIFLKLFSLGINFYYAVFSVFEINNKKYSYACLPD